MANHLFIADITRHLGDSSVLVSTILDQISAYPNAAAEWYVRPDQRSFLTSGCSIIECQTQCLPETLKGRIVELSKNGAAGSIFHIFSYDRFVLGATTALNGPQLCVVGHHLGELVKLEKQGQQLGLRPPSWSSPGLSLAEAISLAKQVLRNGSHTSSENALHQKDLRPKMMRLDSRAHKNYSDPTSHNLITAIVRTGLNQGWLRQESRGYGQTGYEFIWLAAGSSGTSGSADSTVRIATTTFERRRRYARAAKI